MLRSNRWIWMVVALIIAGLAALQLSACSNTSEEKASASDSEPSKVEPIKGTSLKRVILSKEAVERLGVQTARVRLKRISGTQRKVIPYAAVVYTPHGRAFAYTSPELRVFVRQPISVNYIKGDQAVLSHGPPSGTAVVTVGAQELFGVEYEVEED